MYLSGRGGNGHGVLNINLSMNMQIVVSFLLSRQNKSYNHPCQRIKKEHRLAWSKKRHSYLCENLTKTAAMLHVNYDFQITFFGEHWNQLNNKYILIYKRNQSAVIFDWLYLDRVLFNLWIYYTLFHDYKKKKTQHVDLSRRGLTVNGERM